MWSEFKKEMPIYPSLEDDDVPFLGRAQKNAHRSEYFRYQTAGKQKKRELEK